MCTYVHIIYCMFRLDDMSGNVWMWSFVDRLKSEREVFL